MLFTDSFFLFYFLPSALFALFLTGTLRRGASYSSLSKAALVLLTIAFYGSQETWWLIPFAVCVVFDFVWAQLLTRFQSPAMRKLLVALSVIQNLGLLSLFKYWPFIRQNLVAVRPSWDSFLPQLLSDGQSLALPAGISFYTFESLSFVIDVYRRDVVPPKNPLDFAAFIAMFPRFVAGPIVRYNALASQFAQYRGMQVERGLYVFVCGFCLKALFADQFAVFVDYAFQSDGNVGFIAAWLGAFAYTFQIYFDFSGYSLMAIGLGYCLGFRFPDNFNRPYLATTLQEFWKRWHITLSQWLRDYVYIALGGSRGGVLSTYRNLFLTMVLGGVWHGAGWNYLIWGVWHGSWLILERALPNSFVSRPNGFRTFLVVTTGFVFFRAADPVQAFSVLGAMANPFSGVLSFNPTGIAVHALSAGLCLIGIVYCFFIEKYVVYDLPDRTSDLWMAARAGVCTAFLFALTLNFSSFAIPFLYFQF